MTSSSDRIRAIVGGMSFCMLVPLIFIFFLAATPLAGTLTMLIGNAILRVFQFEVNNFTNDLSAARIGALGGLAMIIPAAVVGGFLCVVFPPVAFLIPFGCQVASAVVGCVILQKMHVDIGHIDTRYAAIASSVGAAVLDMGFLIVAFSFLPCVGMVVFGAVAVGSQHSHV